MEYIFEVGRGKENVCEICQTLTVYINNLKISQTSISCREMIVLAKPSHSFIIVAIHNNEA